MRRLFVVSFVALLAPFALPAAVSADTRGDATAAKASASNTLRAGERLKAGRTRRSSNRRYRLTMRRDGNLVLRRGRRLVWSSQTAGNRGAYAAMQTDGNLVVRAKNGTTLFASGTSTSGLVPDTDGSRLVVQGDGKAVVYSGRQALWSSLSDIRQLSSGQLMRPGQSRRSLNGQRRLVMQHDGNLVLHAVPGNAVLWESQTGGHPGAFAALYDDGNFIVRAADGVTKLYMSGTHADPETSLRLLEDGNTVIATGANAPVWSAANDVRQLSAGQRLLAGQSRRSLDGRYLLAMVANGNLVLIDRATPGGRLVWETRTAGNPGAYAAMQTDGNFVVRAPSGATLCHTGTGRRDNPPPANLKVLNDGNVVVLSADGRPLWSRGQGCIR